MSFSHLLSILLHLNIYLAQIFNDYGAWVYGILFIIVFCETGLVITPFLPGDSLLFAAGSLFANTTLNVHVLILVLILAAFCGDNSNYWLGRKVGPVVFHDQRRWLKRSHLDKTHQFYAKHGAKALIIARFVPIVRTFAPFVAGIGTMRYSQFIGFSILGAVLWVGALTYLGYYFGNISWAQKNFSVVIGVIIVLSLLPMVIEFWRHRKKHSSCH